MARRPAITSVSLFAPDGERYTMTQQRRPEQSFGRRYVVVFPDAMSRLSADPKGFPALRVLIWAWGGLSFEVWRSIRQVEVAAQLGVSQSTVTAGLKRLLELGFVERRGAGPRQEWLLTEAGGWRGTAARYQMRRRERSAGLKVVKGGRDDERCNEGASPEESA
jgi:DNA-binding transcriptional ArsR family regulator